MDREDVIEFVKSFDVEKTINLDLSNKDIRELPPQIGNLCNLEHLDLSYNYIEKLPIEIGKLTKLKTLLLLRNEISEIPKQIGMLTDLTLLDVSHNRFTEFPHEISNLVNLKTLDASYGEIKILPLEFIELLSLKELYLEENCFEFPPAKVVKRGLYATMHFLTSEKKKKDAAQVIIQVFNMPEKIQTPFKQYIDYFNDMISSVNEEDVKFDVNFIKQDIQPEIELKVDVENYLYDFLKVIRDKINNLKPDSPESAKLSLIDIQVAELRKQIYQFNDSLDNKMKEIQTIREQMTNFYKLLSKENEK
ncbi:MAG: leucine-rich repeat domain-containing protein [Bacteroidales bacterium]|nr:leucine-rich repeat domain-containing protein [Bacteroidales bacterium]